MNRLGNTNYQVEERSLNLDHIQEIADNDQEFINEILKIFLKTASETLHNLQEAIIRQDHELIRTTAHRYKSSINVLGRTALIDEVKSLEHNAERKKDMRIIKKQVKSLLKMSETLIVQVRNYLRHH